MNNLFQPVSGIFEQFQAKTSAETPLQKLFENFGLSKIGQKEEVKILNCFFSKFKSKIKNPTCKKFLNTMNIPNLSFYAKSSFGWREIGEKPKKHEFSDFRAIYSGRPPTRPPSGHLLKHDQAAYMRKFEVINSFAGSF